MRQIVTIFLILSFGGLSSNCDSYISESTDSVYMDYNYEKLGYKLFAPSKKMFLSYDLEEISGLSYFKNGQLAAIEDERGKLYFIDTIVGDIIRVIKFAKRGDYEGVEIINKKAYVLRSDGDIFQFTISDKDELEAEKEETVLTNKNDAEGLGSLNDELIIALKGSGDTEENKAPGKAIYRYKPNKKKLIEKELLAINKERLTTFIEKRKYFNDVNDFDPSAIATHPKTSDIYVLSADKILAIFNSNYELIEVIRLHPIIYNQTEGICFSPEGTMFISSEGDGGKGKLIRINYVK